MVQVRSVMVKCKFYSKNSKTEYYTVVGGTDEKYEVGICTNSNCVLNHCYFSDCFNNCECFEPERIEYEKESSSKKEQKIEINLKEIKQDAVTQFVNLVDKKLDYYDRRNIKLSTFYLSSMMKEVLHELGYED